MKRVFVFALIFDLLISVVCLTALRKRNTLHLNLMSAFFKETEESVYRPVYYKATHFFFYKKPSTAYSNIKSI